MSRERFVADCECPTCHKYFRTFYLQREHAEETGHAEAQRCNTPHPRTKRLCEREKEHPGMHIYNGAYYRVSFL